MDTLKRWTGAVRSHLLLSGIALAFVAVVMTVVVVQPWASQGAASQYTAENLASGVVSGFLHRPLEQPAAPFTLTDQNGQTVTLEDFRGKWVVAYWLYTSCPDFCPLLTNNMKALQQGLGDRVGKQVQLVTITFDWEHDTVDQMKSYAGLVKADIPGWSWLTGTKQQTDAVAEAYGVSFALSEAHDDGHDHDVVSFDHTALVVVIDPQGIERHRYFGVGWSQDLLDRFNQSLLNSETNGQTSLAVSVDDSPSDGLPTTGADLDALQAEATVFAWEEWELVSGVSSQVMNQFPTKEQAWTYHGALLQQAAGEGGEVTDKLERSTDVEFTAHWTILRKGDIWAAVAGRASINLVFTIEGSTEDAVLETIAEIEGTSLCCF